MRTMPSMTRANCNELARIDTQLAEAGAVERTPAVLAWIDHLLELRLENTPRPMPAKGTPHPDVAGAPSQLDTPTPV